LGNLLYQPAVTVRVVERDERSITKALRKKAVALHAKGEQLLGMEEPSDRRNKLVDEVAELEMDFALEYERMVEVFKPYLKLGNV